MDTNLITRIIGKFLRGNCSDDEFAYLLYWYESFDEETGIELSDEEKMELEQKILQRIRGNIPELEHEVNPESPEKGLRKTTVRWGWYVAAAALVGLVFWGGLRFIRGDHPKPAQVTEVAGGDIVSLNNMSNRIHHIVLPDSSEVWLDPHSKLTYPEKFMSGERHVQLIGEAFFSVKVNAKHPFVVTGGTLVTRVLGTSFLLRAYSGAPVEISVLTGKVAVSREGIAGHLTLSASQKAVLGTDGKLSRQVVDDMSARRWKKVDLSFDNVPFHQVAAALNEQFDVHIHCVQNEINRYTLTADFSNQNLTDILEMLEKSLNLRYEMENDSTINLYINH